MTTSPTPNQDQSTEEKTFVIPTVWTSIMEHSYAFTVRNMSCEGGEMTKSIANRCCHFCGFATERDGSLFVLFLDAKPKNQEQGNIVAVCWDCYLANRWHYALKEGLGRLIYLPEIDQYDLILMNRWEKLNKTLFEKAYGKLSDDDVSNLDALINERASIFHQKFSVDLQVLAVYHVDKFKKKLALSKDKNITMSDSEKKEIENFFNDFKDVRFIPDYDKYEKAIKEDYRKSVEQIVDSAQSLDAILEDVAKKEEDANANS